MSAPRGKTLSGRAFVKYKGEFSWDEIYKAIFKWLLDRRYEVHDKRYKEKKAGPDGYELKSDIVAWRRETSYIKRHFALTIRGFDIKEYYKEVDGEMIRMTGGRIYFKIVTHVEFDWQGIFKGGPFKEFLGKAYDWVKKKEHELMYVDDQEYETLRLEFEIKKLLKMETATMAFMQSN